MRCRPIMYGENIDSDALRQKYHADNVVYFFLFNTPYEHTPNPWSLGFVQPGL